MSETWRRDQTRLLISEFKKYDVLYNRTHPDYRCVEKKRVYLQRIADKLKPIKPDVDCNQVKIKLRTLLKQVGVEKKRMIAAGIPLHKYNGSLWCLESLKFLMQPEIIKAEHTQQDDDTLIQEYFEELEDPTKPSANYMTKRHEEAEEPRRSLNSASKKNRDSTNFESEEPEEQPRRSNITSLKIEPAIKRYKLLPNENERLVETWAMKLNRMDLKQRIFAEKFVNEILLEGQLGTLHRHSMSLSLLDEQKPSFNEEYIMNPLSP